MSFFSELFGNSKYKNINEDELNKISKENKDALIIDVRSVGEFKNGQLLVGLSEHAWGLLLPTRDDLKP